MELKQLESYVAVVEYGSFTKAAEKLYISQPTISTHIQMLEMELHEKLLNRHTKSLEVTPKGQELYECASDMLGLRDRLLKSWSEEENKTIHLGSSTIPSTYILPELLPKYMEEYPEVRFVIHQGDSQNVLDGLLSGNYQVGFIGMEQEQDGVTCVPFYRDHIVLVTPNTEEFRPKKELYEKEKDLSILSEMIKKEPLIVREKGSGSKRYADKVLEDLNIVEETLNICARLNDSESIKNMVMGGMGIALISEKAVHDCCNEGKMLCFDIPLSVAERNLNLIYRKKDIYRAHEKMFVEYVTEYYAKQKLADSDV